MFYGATFEASAANKEILFKLVIFIRHLYSFLYDVTYLFVSNCLSKFSFLTFSWHHGLFLYFPQLDMIKI